MRVGSNFSGIGAWEIALRDLGIDYKLMFFSEIDKYAIKSYCAVHDVDESLNIGDITKIEGHEVPDIDLFVYSPPCQAFSVAGKQGGFDDHRGVLFFDSLRIIKAKQPKIAIMENVKGLTGKKFKAEFQEMLDALVESGYNNYWKVLNAKDYGIPQNRERVFVVSIRKDVDIYADALEGFVWPEPFDSGLRLKHMLESHVDEKYYIDNAKFTTHSQNISYSIDANYAKGASQSDLTNGKRQVVVENIANKEISNTIRSGGRGSLDKHQWDLIAEPNECQVVGKAEGIKGHDILKRVYSPDGCSPTIDTMNGGNREPKVVERTPLKFLDRNGKQMDGDYAFCVDTTQTGGVKEIDQQGFRIRKLTPKETWRLQGFKDTDFDKAQAAGISNSQLYKQAGNSICSVVPRAIFERLIGLLTSEVTEESEVIA